ncbi:adenosine deaminase [Luteipulveratus mongoliensis]|uniref:adenosine deaminase n=1 Tax=Luteipulveratus mongoliensis TaxID=571913 RepID=A0A0K1JNE2_9MICO|nr:adenosine deaminase [Luteipulveratus mongoliensis]AKU18229.1 adenosine deaminase [Luteipulveratus mongoliensis]
MNRLPLVELHRHLEGSVRTSTILEIARREGHHLAAAPRPRDLLVADDSLDGLLPYLDRVDVAASAFTREDDWVRAAREVVLDAYDEGLDVLELRFSPWFVSSQTALAPEAVVDAVTEGVRLALDVVELRVGLVGIMLRDLGPDAALSQLATILSRRDQFCAIDIAGNEAGFAAELFAPAYATAREEGLHLTAHAGEGAGPESVWAAIKHLGVERVGHGVRAVEDPRLMDHLAEHGIALELCFTSNVQTRAAASFETHPVKVLHERGVPVTLNTDNPRVSGVTLAQEHETARLRAGLSDDQLAAIAHQALVSTFVPPASAVAG